MTIDGHTRLAGIIGWPVRHSLSPRLFGYWFREYGVNGAMLPLPVHPDHLEKVLRGLAASGFTGCNLTLPHKEAALRLVDDVGKDARLIGAVNAISIREDLTLFGFNTDHFGFIESLRSQVPKWRATERPCAILGAGGGARAVIHALCDAGASHIRVANRTPARAEKLAEEFAAFHRGINFEVVNWSAYNVLFEGAALLVNTTQAGMVGQPPLDLALDTLPPDAVVSDIVYRPLMTSLLQRARAGGHPIADGLGMLLHQGRPGFKAWFGIEAEVNASLRRHMLEAFAKDS
jgi:shikimate dehydrogenase